MLWNFTDYSGVLTATDARVFSNFGSLIRFNISYAGNQDRVLPVKRETEAIIHFGFEVHKVLGLAVLEIVYKDALEHEFLKNDILFTREKEYIIQYKDSMLRHKFYADFVVFNSVVLEVKAKEGIAADDMARMINYLKCSYCKVGLILNFGRNKLEIKRIVF